MPKKYQVPKIQKINREKYFIDDVLSDVEYPIGDKVFVLMWPVNQVSHIKIFECVILDKGENHDHSINYSVQLTGMYDTRDDIKDFFSCNYFHRFNGLGAIDLFRFDYTIDDNFFNDTKDNNETHFKKSRAYLKKYKKYFKFAIHEACVFSELSDAIKYWEHMSVITRVDCFHTLYYMYTSQYNSPTYINNKRTSIETMTDFCKLYEKPLVELINWLGDDYQKYIRDLKYEELWASLRTFLCHYIIPRSSRSELFYRNNKAIKTYANKMSKMRDAAIDPDKGTKNKIWKYLDEKFKNRNKYEDPFLDL